MNIQQIIDSLDQIGEDNEDESVRFTAINAANAITVLNEKLKQQNQLALKRLNMVEVALITFKFMPLFFGRKKSKDTIVNNLSEAIYNKNIIFDSSQYDLSTSDPESKKISSRG